MTIGRVVDGEITVMPDPEWVFHSAPHRKNAEHPLSGNSREGLRIAGLGVMPGDAQLPFCPGARNSKCPETARHYKLRRARTAMQFQVLVEMKELL